MEPFGTVVIAIAVVAAVLAVVSFVGSGRLYRDIGRGELALDEPEASPHPEPGTAAYDAEARAELRQLLQAKSDRRQTRGQAPLDVESELARLTRPAAAADERLTEELRAMVVASNERRLRRGEAPVDVDAEVERRLRELGGS